MSMFHDGPLPFKSGALIAINPCVDRFIEILFIERKLPSDVFIFVSFARFLQNIWENHEGLILTQK